MSQEILAKVKKLYASFDPSILTRLSDVYRHDVEFIDPIHAVKGIDNLKNYFEASMKGLISCEFVFHHTQLSDSGEEASLFWAMRFHHRKLANGKLLEVDGISHIRFSDKIYYHRDYYDLGAMLYEHVPVLGYVIKKIKQKVGSA